MDTIASQIGPVKYSNKWEAIICDYFTVICGDLDTIASQSSVVWARTCVAALNVQFSEFKQLFYYITVWAWTYGPVISYSDTPSFVVILQ